MINLKNWLGAPVSDAQKEQWMQNMAHSFKTGERRGFSYTLSGDTVVVMIDDGGGGVRIFDCEIRKSGAFSIDDVLRGEAEPRY